MTMEKKCSVCHGAGGKKCGLCNGMGRTGGNPLYRGTWSDLPKCSNCHGVGRVGVCSSCDKEANP